VRRNPPDDRDYVTPQERKGDPPPEFTAEERRSWDALSFYDAENGVRRMAQNVRGPWKFIARYDIPVGAGITWEESIEPGHYDVRGDKELLKRCLTDDVVPL
jgi:hypothetical protein